MTNKNSMLRRLLEWTTIDRVVVFGVMTKLWGFLAGPVTMVVIASYFDPVTQGYYYTFASVLALQVFVVMGLGRSIVCSMDWTQFGVSAEIYCQIAERVFSSLKVPILRIALPDCPTPCSYALENVFYPDYSDIIKTIKKVIPDARSKTIIPFEYVRIANTGKFFGPF